MNPLTLLGMVLGLGFTSGINLYATVLTVGVAIRNGWVTQYPAGLEPLGSDAVIIVAGIMYACEFAADKIPGFDSTWDAIQTFFRPIGGAALAFAATGHADPGFVTLATLIGGSVATVTHLSKAGTRLIINTSPEPVSNWIASTTEDVGAFGIAWLSMVHPYAAMVIVSLIGVVAILTGPMLFRYARCSATLLLARLKAFGGGRRSADFLPGECLALIAAGIQPLQVVKAFHRGLGVGNNRFGYAAITDDALVCFYRRWFKWRHVRLNMEEINCVRLERRAFSNVVEIILKDGRICRVLVGRDRDQLAARFAETARCGSPPAAESTHLMVPANA